MTLILAFNHLELEDFVLGERLERALSALCLKICDAFAEIANHAHHLMNALSSLVALGYQAIDGRQGGCSRRNALNYHGLTKLLVKELRQGNCYADRNVYSPNHRFEAIKPFAA